jgi:hypothetical protein
MLLIKGGTPPTKAARQIGLGRSTLYRELERTPKADPLAYVLEQILR